MFSLRILDSSKFLSLPLATQMLYIHLAMRADDDGIVEATNVLRLVGANKRALARLKDENFIKVLNQDLVSYITDWSEHNTIRKERKKDSLYKSLLVKVLENDRQLSDNCQTNDRQMSDKCPHSIVLDKSSLDKSSCSSIRDNTNTTQKTTLETTTTTEKNDIPTREEIENYCQVANISIDIDDFISYNEMQGWKCKNWKAAVRRWKKNEARFADKKQEQKSETKSSKYDFEAVQKKAFENINKQ